jgi:hypothetical protein
MIRQAIGVLGAVAAGMVCVPAQAAANLSGNYLITLNSVRPAGLKGATACITLTDDGSAGWAHSGSWAFQGQPAGYFYVVGGVLTAYSTPSSSGYITLSGKLYKNALIDTAITDVGISVGGNLTGNFTALAGGC